MYKWNSGDEITAARLNQTGIRFGGTGADGALSITSGTTTIDLGGASVFVKNYTTIDITGTGKLAFSNPNANGTIVILKATGNVTITSSTEPAIDLSGMGGIGGGTLLGGYGGINGGVAGQGGGFYYSGGGGGACSPRRMNASGYGGANLNSAGGIQVSARYDSGYVDVYHGGSPAGIPLPRLELCYIAYPGGGGGGGSCVSGFDASNGARGGGGLLIECKGSLNFTGKIWSKGISSATATARGGGGAGGSILIRYDTLTANTGTIVVTGGEGGTAGSIGQSLVEAFYD